MHPGRVLRNKLRGCSVFELAAQIGIDAKELQQILDEQEDIDRKISAKLAKTLGTTPEFWLILQFNYNRWQKGQKREE